jgi:hypothetical protein
LAWLPPLKFDIPDQRTEPGIETLRLNGITVSFQFNRSSKYNKEFTLSWTSIGIMGVHGVFWF